MAALLLPVVSAGSEADDDKAGGVELVVGCGEKVTELTTAAPFGCWAVLPVKAAARCLSLEILRGRGCKGDGAALRLPLAGLGPGPGIEFAEADDWDWEPEPEEEVVGCWRPCWYGRWWQAVRRRPHWLHRARGSRPLSLRLFALWLLPTVANRLALTIVVTAAAAVAAAADTV
jgi:hypothetical protein